MASFLEIFTFDSYHPASEKQLQPIKRMISRCTSESNFDMEACSRNKIFFTKKYLKIQISKFFTSKLGNDLKPCTSGIFFHNLTDFNLGILLN